MKKIFLIFPLIFLSCFLNSPTLAEKSSKEGNSDWILLLPINHLSEKRISLVVNIPKKYKPLGTFPSQSMEFIPEGDDEQKYSQIITINVFAGTGVSASTFLDKIKSGMESETPSFKLLKEDKKDEGSYTMASLAATYEQHGRNEIVYMRYFSGPADLCGIQYAKPLGKNESPEQALNDLRDKVDKVSQVNTLPEMESTHH
ncbi:MAG: hypothetical protein BGO67_08115 [Alphaproteobacteria bacterium 41-28]|nr:MAG: hypothetical protein BGO67_08115 [Alphaproteobacteria bacterium 41-28]